MIILILIHTVSICLAHVSWCHCCVLSQIWPDSHPARPSKCDRSTNVSLNFHLRCLTCQIYTMYYEFSLNFSCLLFVCHFMFASILICLHMCSQCFYLDHKQWIRYVMHRLFFGVTYSGLVNGTHIAKIWGWQNLTYIVKWAPFEQ